jgi:hypothetical protein
MATIDIESLSRAARRLESAGRRGAGAPEDRNERLAVAARDLEKAVARGQDAARALEGVRRDLQLLERLAQRAADPRITGNFERRQLAEEFDKVKARIEATAETRAANGALLFPARPEPLSVKTGGSDTATERLTQVAIDLKRLGLRNASILTAEKAKPVAGVTTDDQGLQMVSGGQARIASDSIGRSLAAIEVDTASLQKRLNEVEREQARIADQKLGAARRGAEADSARILASDRSTGEKSIRRQQVKKPLVDLIV